MRLTRRKILDNPSCRTFTGKRCFAGLPLVVIMLTLSLAFGGCRGRALSCHPNSHRNTKAEPGRTRPTADTGSDTPVPYKIKQKRDRVTRHSVKQELMQAIELADTSYNNYKKLLKMTYEDGIRQTATAWCAINRIAALANRKYDEADSAIKDIEKILPAKNFVDMDVVARSNNYTFRSSYYLNFHVPLALDYDVDTKDLAIKFREWDHGEYKPADFLVGCEQSFREAMPHGSNAIEIEKTSLATMVVKAGKRINLDIQKIAHLEKLAAEQLTLLRELNQDKADLAYDSRDSTIKADSIREARKNINRLAQALEEVRTELQVDPAVNANEIDSVLNLYR